MIIRDWRIHGKLWGRATAEASHKKSRLSTQDPPALAVRPAVSVLLSDSFDDEITKTVAKNQVKLGGPITRYGTLLGITFSGWLILRASVCVKVREIVYQRAVAAVLADPRTFIASLFPCQPSQRTPKCDYRASWSYLSLLNTTTMAA